FHCATLSGLRSPPPRHAESISARISVLAPWRNRLYIQPPPLERLDLIKQVGFHRDGSVSGADRPLQVETKFLRLCQPAASAVLVQPLNIGRCRQRSCRLRCRDFAAL